MQKVYVLNKDGKPLMPTKASRARKMLRDGKAKVAKRTPFTIQMLVETKEYKQDITLGIDAGSKTIGISATTDKEELFSSEVILRNDISDLLTARRQCRRTRRNRLRYRKPRFLNRVGSKNKGWLAPSIEHKIQTHIRAIGNVVGLLPISKIIVETASFDVQKILNPEISGKDYQQGSQFEFANARDCVLFRDNYKCQNPKCKSKNSKLHVHHIIQRKDGGSNRIKNLITLCETCHNNHHNGKKVLELLKPKQFNHAAFMGIMRQELLNRLYFIYGDMIEETFGYITKQLRIDNNLPKEHKIDALCITGNPHAKQATNWYLQKKVRCHNRQIHKNNILKGGKLKANQADFEVFGFRLFDKVKFENKEWFVFGRRKSGFFDIRDLDGNKVNKGSVSYKRLELLEHNNGLIIERRMARAIPPLP